jgi:hypothetical protein
MNDQQKTEQSPGVRVQDNLRPENLLVARVSNVGYGCGDPNINHD